METPSIHSHEHSQEAVFMLIEGVGKGIQLRLEKKESSYLSNT
jgi:hypothetical protein